MKNICLIRQPAGLGDIFFCQKIAKLVIDKLKLHVIWPVLPHFLYVRDYINYPDLEFCSIAEDFVHKDIFNDNTVKNIIRANADVIIPLHGGILTDDSVMISKYKLVNLDWNDWNNYFTFKRNKEKENKLFYDVLKLTDNTKYNFVNQFFASPPQEQKVNISINNNLQNVNLTILPDFTVFDWCKVIENANQISIVDTSLNYIIEKLNLKSQKNFLNSRFTPPNFIHIINLFQKNWSYLN